MKLFKKIIKLAGISLLLIITVPLLVGQVLKLAASEEPPPGKLVDVGGFKLHINCVGPTRPGGEKPPTVITEAGAGTASPNYHWTLNGVAEKTRACVYDRAGYPYEQAAGWHTRHPAL